jgi:hypothetical protein
MKRLLGIAGWIYFVILPAIYWIYFAIETREWLLIFKIPLSYALLWSMWKRTGNPP